MSDREEYNKFWKTLAEKAADVRKEYNNLSDANKQRVDHHARTIIKTAGIAGLLDLIRNPPPFQ